MRVVSGFRWTHRQMQELGLTPFSEGPVDLRVLSRWCGSTYNVHLPCEAKLDKPEDVGRLYLSGAVSAKAASEYDREEIQGLIRGLEVSVKIWHDSPDRARGNRLWSLPISVAIALTPHTVSVEPRLEPYVMGVFVDRVAYSSEQYPFSVEEMPPLEWMARCAAME